jgi:2-iminobutanoate/2-iminopropanoate deaminase
VNGSAIARALGATLLLGGLAVNADAQPGQSGSGGPGAAVAAAGLVHVPGTAAGPPGDIREQTRRTLHLLAAALDRAGSDLAHAVTVHVYLARAEDFAAMNEAYANAFPSDPPTRTTIVAGLTRPGALVEMSAVAVPRGVARDVVHPAGWARSPNPYSYGIKTGDVLFLSGVVPRDTTTNRPVEGDVGVQTRVVLDHARQVLAAAGFSLDEVVSARVFLTDASTFERMNTAYREAFGTARPVRATVVSTLMHPAFGVEITLVAARGARRAVAAAPRADGTPGAASPNFNAALSVGRRVYVSGMLGRPAEHASDVRAQTRDALAAIGRTLAEVGVTARDVVDATVYLTDAGLLPAVDEVWREVFGEAAVARTVVQTGLVVPGALVEVAVTAVCPVAP